MEQIIFVGNLGRGPEMRYIPSGQAVTSFSVGVNRKYTSNGQEVKETTWFRVSTWGKLAEVCSQYLAKGRKVMVIGRLQPDKASGGPRIYTNKAGEAASSYEVTASSVEFLDSKSSNSSGEEVGEEEPGAAAAPVSEEDIPF